MAPRQSGDQATAQERKGSRNPLKLTPAWISASLRVSVSVPSLNYKQINNVTPFGSRIFQSQIYFPSVTDSPAQFGDVFVFFLTAGFGDDHFPM